MNEDDRGLSGAYAADAVNDDERAAHEALIRRDPDLAEETRSLTEAVSELSKVTEQAPPAHLRADVLKAIKTVRPLPPLAGDATDEADHESARADLPIDRDSQGSGTPPDELRGRRLRRRGVWIGAGAAAAAAIVAVVVVLGLRNDPSVNQADAVISASDVSSQAATVDDWSATLYWSDSRDSAVISSKQMPDAPAGHDFQVWLIHDDGTITSAGLMPRSEGSGQEYLVPGVLDQVAAIAISEEPAGGSEQPSATPFFKVAIT